MLYTMVFDWKGGTYVSQVRARSVHTAFKKWAKGLNANEVPGLGRAGHGQLCREMEAIESVSIEGLRNVWCRTCALRGELALINAIQTDAGQRS